MEEEDDDDVVKSVLGALRVYLHGKLPLDKDFFNELDSRGLLASNTARELSQLADQGKKDCVWKLVAYMEQFYTEDILLRLCVFLEEYAQPARPKLATIASKIRQEILKLKPQVPLPVPEDTLHRSAAVHDASSPEPPAPYTPVPTALSPGTSVPGPTAQGAPMSPPSNYTSGNVTRLSSDDRSQPVYLPVIDELKASFCNLVANVFSAIYCLKDLTLFRTFLSHFLKPSFPPGALSPAVPKTVEELDPFLADRWNSVNIHLLKAVVLHLASRKNESTVFCETIQQVQSELKTYEDLLKVNLHEFLSNCKSESVSLKPLPGHSCVTVKIASSPAEVSLALIVELKGFFNSQLGLPDTLFTGFSEGCTILFFSITTECVWSLPSGLLPSNLSLLEKWKVIFFSVKGAFTVDIKERKVIDSLDKHSLLSSLSEYKTLNDDLQQEVSHLKAQAQRVKHLEEKWSKEKNLMKEHSTPPLPTMEETVPLRLRLIISISNICRYMYQLIGRGEPVETNLGSVPKPVSVSDSEPSSCTHHDQLLQTRPTTMSQSFTSTLFPDSYNFSSTSTFLSESASLVTSTETVAHTSGLRRRAAFRPAPLYDVGALINHPIPPPHLSLHTETKQSRSYMHDSECTLFSDSEHGASIFQPESSSVISTVKRGRSSSTSKRQENKEPFLEKIARGREVESISKMQFSTILDPSQSSETAKLTSTHPYWRQEPDIPEGIWWPTAVCVKDKIFVCTKWYAPPHLCVFNVVTRRWSKLKFHESCELDGITLATTNSQLHCLGGGRKDARIEEKYSKLVFTLDCDSLQWSDNTLPPLNIGRMMATSTSFEGMIVVAGGEGANGRLSSVEVLNSSQQSSTWWKICDLPVRSTIRMQCTVSDTDLFIGSGYGTKLYSCNLSAVKEAMVPGRDGTSPESFWHALPETPLQYSGLAVVNNCLVAVGDHDGHDLSSVHLYDSYNNTWSKVSDLRKSRNSLAVVFCNFENKRNLFIFRGRVSSTTTVTAVESCEVL